jgi:heat shock protein HslJ
MKTNLIVGVLFAVIIGAVGATYVEQYFFESNVDEIIPAQTQKKQGGEEQTPTMSDVNLNGSTFRLVSFNKSDVLGKYLLTFTDSNISVRFCNQMSGIYTLSGENITGSLMSTRMYCESPAEVMQLETAFGQALLEGAKFQQSGSDLYITSKQNQEFHFAIFMD